MRKTTLLVLILSNLFIFSVVHAQELSPEKAALYTKYYELKKGGAEGQKQAYELAKDFLQKFGSDTDQYTEAVRKFVAAYDKALREVNFYKAYNAKDYVKAFEIGRQILNGDTENFVILGTLARAGYFSAYEGNKSLTSETVAIVKKALELAENNKVPKPDPFESLDQGLGFLNFVLGFLLEEQAPAEAVAALMKAARVGGTKDQASTYYYLARAILKGEYEPLSGQYRREHVGKDETPEGKAMYEKLINIGNRALDAYARAIAMSTKPEQAKFKNQMLAEMTEVYKDFHNNSTDGLNDLIANVLSKPLPQ